MAKKAKKYRVVSDNFSNHGLPVGAIVEPCDGPEWSNCNYWYTLGGEDDATAIDSRDLESHVESCRNWKDFKAGK